MSGQARLPIGCRNTDRIRHLAARILSREVRESEVRHKREHEENGKHIEGQAPRSDRAGALTVSKFCRQLTRMNHQRPQRVSDALPLAVGSAQECAVTGSRILAAIRAPWADQRSAAIQASGRYPRVRRCIRIPARSIERPGGTRPQTIRRD